MSNPDAPPTSTADSQPTPTTNPYLSPPSSAATPTRPKESSVPDLLESPWEADSHRPPASPTLAKSQTPSDGGLDSDPDSNSNSELRKPDYTLSTTITFPSAFTPQTEWVVSVGGAGLPVGSQWRMYASGRPIPGLNIFIPLSGITASDQVSSCIVRNVPASGYTAKLFLQWFSNGVEFGSGVAFNFLPLKINPPKNENELEGSG